MTIFKAKRALIKKIANIILTKEFCIYETMSPGNIRRAWPGDFVMESMKFAGPRLKLRLPDLW